MEFSHTPPRPEPTVYNLGDRPAVTVGRHSYFAPHSRLMVYWFPPEVAVGNFTSVAANCRFFARQNHHPEWVTTYPVELFLGADAGHGRHAALPGRITLGSDVWVGDGATFLPGVTVGDGAVVGANAVVAKDVPPFAVAVGNPARVARHRFPPDVVEALLALRWWDWPDDRIREYAPLIWSADVRAFLAAAAG